MSDFAQPAPRAAETLGMYTDNLSIFLFCASLVAAAAPLAPGELADVEAWIRRLGGRDRPVAEA